MPEWYGKLQWLLIGSIGLLVAQAASDQARTALNWVGIGMLGWLLYVMNTNEKLKEAKFLVTAIFPYLVVNFVFETVRLINVNFIMNGRAGRMLFKPLPLSGALEPGLLPVNNERS